MSPYDPETMSCRGLQRYMSHLLPATDWGNESMKQTLLTMLRRVDKMFVKIYKKPSIRVRIITSYERGVEALSFFHRCCSNCSEASGLECCYGYLERGVFDVVPLPDYCRSSTNESSHKYMPGENFLE